VKTAWTCELMGESGLLIVGAGPAGLAAAYHAAKSGLHVTVVDDNPAVGGQIWRGEQPKATSAEARAWFEKVRSVDIEFVEGARVFQQRRPGVLLAETRHDVRELSADKAYSSVENHNVLDSFGVEAFIPFKINAVVNPKAPVWSRHLCEFTLNQERFLAHYHRRSNVETVFHMMKARFGASVSSRLPTAQVNEVLAMCVAHNLCCLVKAIFTAGLAPTFWQDAPAALPSQLPEEQP